MSAKRRLIHSMTAIFEIKTEIETMNPEQTIKHIRGDANSAFGKIVQEDDTKDKIKNVCLGPAVCRPNLFTSFLAMAGIELYLQHSKFVNKNRVIDRVIRTIRDKVGENHMMFYRFDIVKGAVDEYDTPHSAFNYEFTPKEVQMHKDLEEYYIRENMRRLDEVKVLQFTEGLLFYRPGDILLIHVDFKKTDQKLAKTRRTFNHLATFLGYDHGNIVCKVIYKTTLKSRIFENTITIPIYYTKFVAESFKEITKPYLKLYF
jgi:hypothetical protein